MVGQQNQRLLQKIYAIEKFYDKALLGQLSTKRRVTESGQDKTKVVKRTLTVIP